MIKQKFTVGAMCNVNVEGPNVVVYVGGDASVGQGSTVAVGIYAGENIDVNDSGSFMTTYMYGLFITEELNSGDNVVWGWNLNCGGAGGGSGCVTVGGAIGNLSPVLKGSSGFCPTPPQVDVICDCPVGYIAVGYSGLQGNEYGSGAVGEFTLHCKELLSNGTLGASIVQTCSNGTNVANNAVPVGPILTTGNDVMVGGRLRNGCGVAQVRGYSKPLSEILSSDPNTNSTLMAQIGGTGGSQNAPQWSFQMDM